MVCRMIEWGGGVADAGRMALGGCGHGLRDFGFRVLYNHMGSSPNEVPFSGPSSSTALHP